MQQTLCNSILVSRCDFPNNEIFYSRFGDGRIRADALSWNSSLIIETHIQFIRDLLMLLGIKLNNKDSSFKGQFKTEDLSAPNKILETRRTKNMHLRFGGACCALACNVSFFLLYNFCRCFRWASLSHSLSVHLKMCNITCDVHVCWLGVCLYTEKPKEKTNNVGWSLKPIFDVSCEVFFGRWNWKASMLQQELFSQN